MLGMRKSAFGRGGAPAVIIVNNLDHPVRYAAWFGSKRAKAAIDLATASRFNALDVDSAVLEELASRLSEGTLGGRALTLATVAEELAHELETVIRARQAADAGATEADAQQALRTAQDAVASADFGTGEYGRSSNAERDAWSELQAGALVLAADLDRQGAPEAWYEAIIVRAEGREFVLRWRDYPRDGLLTRTRQQIAILPPAD
jgi:hypothetical protein